MNATEVTYWCDGCDITINGESHDVYFLPRLYCPECGEEMDCQG